MTLRARAWIPVSTSRSPARAITTSKIHDARFSKQTQNFYRLKMGSYAYADGIFPLGGKRGEATEVTFFGTNLKTPVKTARWIFAESRSRKAAYRGLRYPIRPLLPVNFAVSDLPELIGGYRMAHCPFPA
jgi:hypothetical protein